MNRPRNREDAGDLAAHAALTPPGTELNPEAPEDAGDLVDRPGEDLLGSEGEALMPPSEPGTGLDREAPEDVGDLMDRPGEDLLGSEGEALMPPSEAIHGDSLEAAVPIDETILATLDAHDDGDTADALSVHEGELVRQIEDIFPLVWLAMLLTVCYIAIYFAIEQLPNRGNPLPGPDMFF